MCTRTVELSLKTRPQLGHVAEAIVAVCVERVLEFFGNSLNNSFTLHDHNSPAY